MAEEIVGVTIPELPAAGALVGTEPIETVQAGASVRTTAAEIAALGSSVVEITRAELLALAGSWNLQTTYVITDAIGGGDRVRVYVRSAVELTAAAMKEGVDDGTGSITAGQWGNYDLDGDVFTPTSASGTWTPVITDQAGAATVTVSGTSFYSQMGEIVTDSCTLVVTMDAGQSIEEFNLSCAVTPASNFGSVGAASPIWSAKSPISEYDTVTIKASTGTKKTYVSITMNGTEIEAILTIQRTYSIL